MHSESPYGKVLREFNEATDARYLTTHHERDKETGFDYRGARFYDSDLGRFLSLDPLAIEYPSFSDYSYVAGNPIMFIDPTGKSVENTIYIGTNGEELGVSKDNLTDAVVEIDPSKVEQFKKEWAAAELAGTKDNDDLNTAWRTMGTAFDIRSILAFYEGNTTEFDTEKNSPDLPNDGQNYLKENGAFIYNIDGLLTVGPERYVGGFDWTDFGNNNINSSSGNARLRASKIHTHPNMIGPGGPSEQPDLSNHNDFPTTSKIVVDKYNVYFYNRSGKDYKPRRDYYLSKTYLQNALSK